MSEWSPPQEDFADDVNMGEGLDRGGPMRVSSETQAARDQRAALLRATYEPEGDQSNLRDVERVIQANAGGKSKLAAVLKNWTPPAGDFQQASFKPPESDFAQEQAPSLVDQLLQPWKGETVGSLFKQNAIVRMHDYIEKINELDAEIAKANPELGMVEVERQARQQYKEKYGQAPELDINWSDLPKNLYDQITKTPALFVSNLVKSFVVDPELALVGTTGLPAKLGGVAGGAARAAEVGAQMGVQSAGISAAEQLEKTGEVRAQPTAQAGVSGAAMGVALGAIHAGLRSVGAKNGIEVTPAVEAEAAKRFDSKIADGATPDEALTQTMREAGMSDAESQRMGAALAPANDALANALRMMDEERGNAPGERIKQEGDLGEHTPGDQVRPAPEAGGSDSLQRGAEGEAARIEPGTVAHEVNLPHEQANVLAENMPPSTLFEFETPDGKRVIIDGRGVEHAQVSEQSTAIREAVIQGASAAERDIRSGESVVGETGEPTRLIPAESGRAAEGKPLEAGDRQAVVQRLKDYERRIQTGVEGLEGEAKYEALRDTSIKLAELQGGGTDPKVLAALGLGSAAGAAAWLYSNKPEQAIAAAVAAGSLPFLRGAMTRLTGALTSVNDRFFADTRYNTKDIFRSYAAERAIVPEGINKWADQMRVARGDPHPVKAALEAVAAPFKRKEREARWIDQRDALQGYADAEARLTPAEKAVNQQIDTFRNAMFDRAEKHNVIRDFLENFLPGIYRKPLKASWDDIIDRLLQQNQLRQGQGMSPHTRHAMQKVIPDYRTLDQLRETGEIDLVPLTNDPIEMMRMYAHAVSKAIANKKLIENLKETPGPGKYSNDKPIPLVVPITPEGAAKRITQGNARLRDQFDIDPESIKAMNAFDIMRAPKDYEVIRHPSLEGYRVHKDIAGPLKLLFNESAPNMVMNGANALSMASKGIMFMGSPFFHMINLSQVAMPYAIRHPSFIKNIGRSGKMLSQELFAPEMRDALSHGLLLKHGVEDYNLNGVNGLLERARTTLGNVTPLRYGESVPAALQEMQKAFKWMLWDVVQPSLKLGMYMTEVPAAIVKNARQHAADSRVPLKSAEQIKREVSTAVNGSFGGMNWFEMANNIEPKLARDLATVLYSPSGRKLQQTMLIAPDWLHASIQAWTKGLAASAPFTKAKASDSLYRTVLWGQVAMYALVGDYLSQKWTGKPLSDQEDWTFVETGDGRKVQLNKHLMEMLHFEDNPTKFVVNKLSFPAKEGLAQAFGREYVTYNKKTGDIGPKMQDTGLAYRLLHAVKEFGIPIAGKVAIENPESVLPNILGFPVYGKTFENRIKAAGDKAEEAGKSRAAAEAKAARYWSPSAVEQRKRNEQKREQKKQAQREAR